MHCASADVSTPHACLFWAAPVVQIMQVTATKWGKHLVGDPEQQVTQVFGSACPISYSGNDVALWRPLAQLVLSASYEATLLAAAANAAKHTGEPGARRVFLTMLGGGVFGNDPSWIVSAIAGAIVKCKHFGLEVHVVQYSAPAEPEVRRLMQDWQAHTSGKVSSLFGAPGNH